MQTCIALATNWNKKVEVEVLKLIHLKNKLYLNEKIYKLQKL